MTDALKRHWPEYLMEAACLGLFMISAFTFGAILENPTSPVNQAIPNPSLRRFLMGLAMGSTAVGIVYSRWGKQSGAHINPSTTITFFRLGKVAPWDVVFYIVFQFIGGLAGALLASVVLSTWVSHPSVHYVVTTPGSAGAGIAFAAEIGISFILMTVILNVSNNTRWHKFTGLCAGVLIATYITFEAPISGMSMNLARTVASALPAQHWTALWIYITAPLIGMLAAAEVYVRTKGMQSVSCAKLNHDNDTRCIFCGKPAGKISSESSLAIATRISKLLAQ
ncbi:MAG TPA: aquaporin [Candidatus Binatia bacterium]|nr:aquaporin [Candidatus Binatia bacterium]